MEIMNIMATFLMTTTLKSTHPGHSCFNKPGRYYLKWPQTPQIISYLHSKTFSAGSGESNRTKNFNEL